MNAYELADELNRKLTGRLIGFIAIMLRQQADKIADLEGEVAHLKHINKNWSISEGWALQSVAELEKQHTTLQTQFDNLYEYANSGDEKQSEPVAWLHIQGNYYEAHDRQLFDFEIERGWEQKPLYTTPQTKLLSDSERYELLEKYQGIELCVAIEAKVRGEK